MLSVLVDVEVVLWEEEVYDLRGMVLDCKLKWRIVIYSTPGGVGPLDKQERNDLGLLGLNGQMQGVAPAISILIQQVLMFFLQKFWKFLLILDRWLFFH